MPNWILNQPTRGRQQSPPTNPDPKRSQQQVYVHKRQRTDESSMDHIRHGRMVTELNSKPTSMASSYPGRNKPCSDGCNGITMFIKPRTIQSNVPDPGSRPQAYLPSSFSFSSRPTKKLSKSSLKASSATDPWRILYCLEKERLSAPPEMKPSAYLFFTDCPTNTVRETTSQPGDIMRHCIADQYFGTAPERKAHVREIKVTFSQIWNRTLIHCWWTRFGQDSEGYLDLREEEKMIQLQRQHGPWTLFFAPEAGDLSIMDISTVAPDVCFRLVDAEGQNFVRCSNKYDLRCTEEVEEGQLEASVKGVDGEEIMFNIAGTKQVRIPGKGMPKDWEGKYRGDLIIDLVIH